ncbi:conserved hypothetical protein [Cupriavidus taiwanensis]|uniref:Uncharacterized protein n=1 Tax=Cupriavidus taiwanensis TaxID=164546 RepID=A0A375EAC5_9BURK|nr:hypothetical protein [Cupriavidus taiwanensis]SOZ19351.1 conserved hypothetical protein [Cupriavidus taiwanensis]SOZ32546.1 conserved hypothetical protein [Cupriavidus taiwanensis]SOZ48133.1 conserved hypothetical protein [Cupriavidus taiwanensis]SOZ69553.1 conserved hypothetical protein [Cupriavidus taiwanensis]SOZ70292.1 conserved hypothetical protein [Cupriavidus taiwanensis]
MHDIGTSRPGGWGTGYNELEQELASELMEAGELGQELGGMATEFEGEFEGEGEFENEFEQEVSGEMQEMELAAELLAVNSEQEMEQFLGGLVRSVGRAASSFARSSAGKALGGILRSAAKAALPVVGSALGNLVVPGAGGAIGGKLASMAGSALGLELEGLSNEDREFEVARRVVRIGQQATRNLLTMPRNVPPSRAARAAFLQAARQVAPGLLPAMRTISQNGVAAARQLGTPPIFGPAASGAAGAQPVASLAAAVRAPYAGYANGGTAPCPSCGNGLAAQGGVGAAALPLGGQWRRSRNGRALILYLAPQRPLF